MMLEVRSLCELRKRLAKDVARVTEVQNMISSVMTSVIDLMSQPRSDDEDGRRECVGPRDSSRRDCALRGLTQGWCSSSSIVLKSATMPVLLH